MTFLMSILKLCFALNKGTSTRALADSTPGSSPSKKKRHIQNKPTAIKAKENMNSLSSTKKAPKVANFQGKLKPKKALTKECVISR